MLYSRFSLVIYFIHRTFFTICIFYLFSKVFFFNLLLSSFRFTEEMGRKYRMYSLSYHTPSLTSCTGGGFPSYNWWANTDKWLWKPPVHIRVHLMLNILWVLTNVYDVCLPLSYHTEQFHCPQHPLCPPIPPSFPLSPSKDWSFYRCHSRAFDFSFAVCIFYSFFKNHF